MNALLRTRAGLDGVVRPLAVSLDARRWVALDRVRGLAIVLMIADHALAVAGAPVWTRLNITRLSLPLFMLVSGWLLCGRSRPSDVRCVQLALATVLAAPASAVAGLGAPDILFVYCVALLGWHLLGGSAALATTIGMVAAYTLPLGETYLRDVQWDGYQPGYVLGLIGVGALLRRGNAGHRYFAWGERLPRVLERVGQVPLTIFVLQAWAFAAWELAR